jgi:hypothetical protein
MPPSMLSTAGINEGDLVQIWSPMGGVIVAEKIIMGIGAAGGNGSAALVYREADRVIEEMRVAGFAIASAEEKECAMCHRDRVGLVYRRFQLCRACEGAIALGRATELAGFFRGKISEGS